MLPNRPGPRLVLAMSQFQAGAATEALHSLAVAVRGYNWKSGRPTTITRLGKSRPPPRGGGPDSAAAVLSFSKDNTSRRTTTSDLPFWAWRNRESCTKSRLGFMPMLSPAILSWRTS